MAVEEPCFQPGGITPLQQILASGTGALITSFFVTPLDVVKIRLQAQRKPFSKALSIKSLPWTPTLRHPKWRCFLYCNGLMDHLFVCQHATACSTLYRTPTHFHGTVDAFVKITRHEGLKSLWSGLPPTLVMAIPATIIYFTCYDQLRDFMRYQLGYQGSHIPLIAGALARLGAVTVISPLELIRTKQQSRQLSYIELSACLRSAVSQDGWRSLWKGWGPTVLRDVPFSALYWFNYELLKSRLNESCSALEAPFLTSFTAGAVSGTVAAILTLPFDVVKTQRQIELGDIETGVSRKQRSTTWGAMRRIKAESGTRGLFAGFLPRVIKVAPACAIMISSYEFGKNFFQQQNMEKVQNQ
ncbi:probable mitochondrial glutathione transporter SLC25A39 isoform X1 [Bombina bombina]|uniref:probable mitochondrial glutathione transporter SLC25A39 isoform X1 n=1 Tax=Bombina bombina TaxID=8345 RepID=UPI00235AC3BD|nr:probable mitochondrial glutathione transporter SLC25A39 isoform X1 [Bombina bombina]XP_053555964.1 probable mitochondrial glutathione transporter SLC25A39 isoform X1 [Bombina bombina]XP_053555967.1 probable mitochondrial glutathione transporter SLC25A39 isoform X1 [Bombina bombina]XP_053555970.1 probable mitochondrial glutathione transporter SLC25A39 isoform X1 [Bombina bombina]XP_053555973.1 probable mitochondrial glutathione transporter SLC25A39 isoform X1 [Bombina bombina]XP_053555974.1 